MMDISHERAREVIAKIRRDNGGISAERREYLAANMPDVLEAIAGPRRKLAAATKM